MLMALNSLAVVETNPTIETKKQMIQFLNYTVTHPYAITEYRKSVMILHIYLDASYISEPEARSRPGGYFSEDKNPIQRYRRGPRRMYQCM